MALAKLFFHPKYPDIRVGWDGGVAKNELLDDLLDTVHRLAINKQ